MRKFKYLIVSTVVLIVGVIILSVFITDKLNDYKDKQTNISEQLNFENRLLNAWEWVPMTNVGEEMVKTWQELEVKAKADYNGALFYGMLLLVWVAIYGISNIFVYKDAEVNYRAYGFVAVFAALSFLYLGLSAPLLEISAFSEDLTFDIPTTDLTGEERWGIDLTFLNYERVVEGRTYYFYQNKSILQLIKILYTGGNFLVAFILIGFSIVFPAFKLFLSFRILAAPHKKRSLKQYRVIRSLGKWSMADVFVSAIFLAIFAYSNMEVGIDTGSSTLAGTYFFMIFVVISISSGTYLKKSMKKAQDVAEWTLE
ncbi:MAG: hypothetical protein GQ574_11760 [Crocinitomix sp.]|nr:hypothetical protein [Crocinitomix sp.]